MASLAQTLKNSGHNYPLLRQLPECFETTLDEHGKEIRKVFSEERMKMLTEKSVFPYSYLTSVSRLKETKDFPAISEFTDDLKNSTISKEAWQTGLKIWETFEIKNLHQYLILYLKIDTILLGKDSIKNFKKQFFNFKFYSS